LAARRWGERNGKNQTGVNQMLQERRFNSHATLRASDPGGGIGATIEGYAARFGVYADLGDFFEQIAPGAFTRSLQSDRDVICNRDHDNSRILGRLKNKTLELNEDSKGLYFRCSLPNTTDGNDVKELLKNGTLADCSFAFSVDNDGEDWTDEDRSDIFSDDECECDPDSPDYDPDDPDCNCDEDEDRSSGRVKRVKVRTLRSVSLFDVSVVSTPAYPKTSVGLSSLPHSLGRSQKDFFPEGIPAEVRTRVGTAALNPKAQESRRRLFNLFVG
jgi:HK97 family phage prohead protease